MVRMDSHKLGVKFGNTNADLKNASVQVIQQCMPDYRVTKDTNTCTTAAKTIEQQKQNKKTRYTMYSK